MALSKAPVILVFLADGAIAKGKAVKFGSDDQHVVVCSATTDKAIGVCQNEVTTAGDLVEVAMNGGGAKGLAKAAIAAGDILGVNADGSLQKAAGANDRVIGISMNTASAGDIFGLEIALGMATQAQA